MNDTYGLVYNLYEFLKYIKQVYALLKDTQHVMKALKSRTGKVQIRIWIVAISGPYGLAVLSFVLFGMFKVLHNLRFIILAP